MARSVFGKLLLVAIWIFAQPVNAAFIINGSTTVEAIAIGESFESFYGYGEAVSGSSNTGFEKNDTIVMMIVENAGSYALVVTFDDTIAPDTWDRLQFTLTDNSSSMGSFIFVDDPIETSAFSGNVYTALHGFANGLNDGFVYSLGNGLGIDISFFTEFISGTLTDSVFLSADGTGTNEIALGGLGLTTISSATSVHSPGVLLLMLLGVFTVLMVARRT